MEKSASKSKQKINAVLKVHQRATAANQIGQDPMQTL
jgi:hypothetical protein